MMRRADWHDYRSRCFYMITIQAAEGAPLWASVKAEPQPHSELTTAGKILLRAFTEVIDFHPCMSIRKFVVMPDHAHFVIFVERRLDRALGCYVGKAKAKATAMIREASGSPGLTAFKAGFNDRAVRGRTQLETLLRYVEDNPRRLVVRRQHPALFTSYHSVDICGRRFDAYGNMFLLDEAEFEPVIVHRAWDEATLATATERWRRCAVNGGVLVSAFISGAEKDVMRAAFELGGRAILITKDLISERYKPSGEYFDLCAEGRLLILRPEEMAGGSYRGILRAEALALNRVAESLAGALSRGAFAGVFPSRTRPGTRRG